ncbi:MAG: RNA polymerase sigma factor [Clostridium sp.]
MNNNSARREEVDIILDKYSKMVFRLAFSRTKNTYDAEDIMQEVFMKYINCNISFENENHRKAWLLKVTINCSKSLLSSAWFRKTTAFEDNISIDMKENSDVYKYVLDLPKKYRTVIHLFYYEDMASTDIAKVLDLNECTVRSQIHRGRNILKEKLKGVEF